MSDVMSDVFRSFARDWRGWSRTERLALRTAALLAAAAALAAAIG